METLIPEVVIEENDTEALVAQFMNDSNQHKTELLDVGSNIQDVFASDSRLIKSKLEKLVPKGSPIEDNLVKMQKSLVKVNKEGIVGGFLGLFGDSDASKKLTRMVARYKSSEKTIESIKKALEEGQNILQKDNVELKELKDFLISRLIFLKTNILILQSIIDQLKEKLKDYEGDKEPAEKMLNTLLIRMVDFKTIEEATKQQAVSVEITHDNNIMLHESVKRVCNITLSLMFVTMSIQSAMGNQKRVMEATKATQEFASDLMVQNATSLESNMAETEELYTSPVLNIKRLKEAHTKLSTVIVNSKSITQRNRTKLLTMIEEINKFSLDELPSCSLGAITHEESH
jgi:uncharacterized protein YaaN involved in tellurite resistance